MSVAKVCNKIRSKKNLTVSLGMIKHKYVLQIVTYNICMY